MINSYPGLILPIAAQTGFGTLLFRQYVSQMPDELFDAARIDGAAWWTIFRRLVIPLAKPATAAYVAISVLTAWNMYLWPLVAAEGGSLQVLTQTLALVGTTGQGEVSTECHLRIGSDRYRADDRGVLGAAARLSGGDWRGQVSNSQSMSDAAYPEISLANEECGRIILARPQSDPKETVAGSFDIPCRVRGSGSRRKPSLLLRRTWLGASPSSVPGECVHRSARGLSGCMSGGCSASPEGG